MALFLAAILGTGLLQLPSAVEPAPRNFSAGGSIADMVVHTLGPPTTGVKLADILQAPGAILVIFSTTCGHCSESVPGWRALQAKLDRRAVDFAFLSAHPPTVTSEYLLDHELDAPVYWLMPQEVRRIGLATVPLVVHVAPSGTVRHVWRGVVTSDRVAEIVGSVLE